MAPLAAAEAVIVYCPMVKFESLASFRRMVPKIRQASVDAGRPEDAVRVAGYLFALVDRTRREAAPRLRSRAYHG